MNKNENETQKEMTVGEILRDARTNGRRKREIPTISKQLCIREEFLQALEDGDYNAIPETVYILGFARNYAMELGLDPDEIVAKLKREIGMVPVECGISSDDGKDKKAECDCAVVASATGSEDSAVVVKNTVKHARDFFARYWTWLFGCVVVIFVLVAVVTVLVTPMSSNKTTGNIVQDDVVATTDVVEPAYSVEIRERFGIENRERADVIIQAVQESWVKIEDATGKMVFSRVLVPGDVYYVPNERNYRATFGNAGGMDVWVRGQRMPKIGADHVRKSDIPMNADMLLQMYNPTISGYTNN